MAVDKEYTHDTGNLRILIASTPKTGNTWLKHLLSNIYELPMVDLGPIFHITNVEVLEPPWVAHQHYLPQDDLVEWAHRNEVVFVTTVRHPCDTLVSMFHYTRNLGKQLRFNPSDPSPMMALDGQEIGEHTATYVKHFFFAYLETSLTWIRSGESHLIRYEDLMRDPVAALRELTTSICHVPLQQIVQAIEACGIEQLRTLEGSKPKFFRKGQVGDWRTELPEEIIDLFRCKTPYPEQFAALGYSIDEDYPLDTPPQTPLTDEAGEVIRPPFLLQVHMAARVNPHLPIAWPKWPKGLWPRMEAFSQKVIRRLLRWYIEPIVEQQNQFNSAVVEALDEMWWEISELQEHPPQDEEGSKTDGE